MTTGALQGPETREPSDDDILDAAVRSELLHAVAVHHDRQAARTAAESSRNNRNNGRAPR